MAGGGGEYGMRATVKRYLQTQSQVKLKYEGGDVIDIPAW
jgi:hypothetical protein